MMRTIELEQQSIAFREEGQGRPAFLLIHPAGGSAVSFLELMHLLGQHRRTVALDLPGHGQSEPFAPVPPPAQLIEHYRDVAAECAERLGLGRFVLVGHSMGGAVAQELALAHPERLAGMVLIATGARLKVAPPLLDAIRNDFEQVPQLMSAAGFSPASDPQQIQRWGAQLIHCSREVFWADMKACSLFDQRQRLSEITCRTLVISAADDLLTPPKLQEQLVAGMRHASLETVSRSGHFVMIERPAEVAAPIFAAFQREDD